MVKGFSRETLPEAANMAQKGIMTGQEFKGLGLAQTAYFRPALREGVKVFAIHAADGTQIAIADDEQSAVAVILKSQLIPSFVH
ncbi:DUF1150 family protein [Acetobacteraceae bacterium ESL0709]|nr:DUF1150 family protein [Acetobacteraceae bacterium ESL0697]MDF7677767.1 DUF1150 family protein [Acetobacteraceae bacterium ESL0709]